MTKSLVKNLGFRKSHGKLDIERLTKIIEDGYKSYNKSEYIQKYTFSPSGIGFGSGRCFAGETRFVTDRGLKRLDEMSGQQVRVWTGNNTRYQTGGWKDATVESFGTQLLSRLVLTRYGVDKVVYATREHRWISEFKSDNKKNRDKQKIVTTEELAIGDRLWNAGGGVGKLTPAPDGVRAGVVFGDGDIDISDPRSGARVKLFGEKDWQLVDRYFVGYPISEPIMPEGGQVAYRRVSMLPRSHKGIPRYDESSGFLYGWLAGLFASDGCLSQGGSASISSSSMESIDVIRDICAMLCIATGSVYTRERVGINGKLSDIHSISLDIRSLNDKFFLMRHHRRIYDEMIKKTPRRRGRWSVKSIEHDVRVDEVFCVVQPETERFTLEGDIITMNCPRRWVIAFRGAVFNETSTPASIATMLNGTMAHERIGELFKRSELEIVELEREIKTEDPPVRGFIDVIIDRAGEEVVGEIKTTNPIAFMHRRNSMTPAGYHIVQVLLYLWATDNQMGFVLYENKADHSLLIIPVDRADYESELQELLDWMRMVYKTYEDGQLPKRPYKSRRSAACKTCPLIDTCWDELGEGDIEIETLSVLQ